ncbi:MAG: hypothetical protein HOB98_14785 [Gammaproteobacteria bacterium]|jgi:hypothetical protein|nr:hypothetical protein [Gammaproteobacteria bacterium]MBT3869607.1 hypothetical protein [Gammaproteobacteria bacterium]MBT4377949.1 hypothetical protein [Gammaproteobacteria bacterium]MBT4617708.1 hypothetical protein [Gammaproteobacteria bacterium]
MNPRPFLLLAVLGSMLVLIGALVTQLEAKHAGPGKAPAALPGFLREASGLAVVNEHQLLTHNDEKGHIYSIALPSMHITKLVSLGNPVVLDDFEGIAVDGNSVYMITSTGKLYVIPDVSFKAANQLPKWSVLDTGLAAVCEVEGLHFDDGKLLIPCKNIYKRNGKKKSGKDRVTVYSYAPGEDAVASEFFSLNDDLLKGNKKKVTGIGSDLNFYYFLTPANVLRVNRHTLSFQLLPLDSAVHKQPEGIAIMKNGSVYLVDDRKDGAGGLSHYKNLEFVSNF